MFLATFSIFITVIIVHSIALRVIIRASNVICFATVATIGGFVLMIIAIQSKSYAIGAILFFLFLCELYIFLFTLAANSISVSITIRLLNEESIPVRQIIDIYTPEDMIERRLVQLLNANLIVSDTNGYRVTRNGARLVQIFDCLRAIFRQSSKQL